MKVWLRSTISPVSRKWIANGLALGLFLWCSVSAKAQQDAGDRSGTVVDAHSALITYARVTVANENNGLKKTDSTSEKGAQPGMPSAVGTPISTTPPDANAARVNAPDKNQRGAEWMPLAYPSLDLMTAPVRGQAGLVARSGYTATKSAYSLFHDPGYEFSLKDPLDTTNFFLNDEAPSPEPRRPRGIYAVVDVHQEIAQLEAGSYTPSQAQLDVYFAGLYWDLLADPAISGLALQVHWDTLNPNPPGTPNAYDWTYLDLAFTQVLLSNILNPFAGPKTIQLIITPGFQTPSWVFQELAPCDPLFNGKSAPDCGWVTFNGYQEQADGNKFPLPWSPIYQSAWKTFLTALAARYGSNPALVSIAVDGPTAASAEMILPSDATATNHQPQNNLSPNDMWETLFATQLGITGSFTDQPFIDQWTNAIDMFGELFSGLTLTVATGDGLPNFTPGTDYPVPVPFVSACPDPNMDCYSQALILAYFIEPTVGGANAKATQTSGMEANRADPDSDHDMGVAAVKGLSHVTESLSSPSAQILGGAQFNTSFSNDPVGEGCLSSVPPPTMERSAQCASELKALSDAGTPCGSQSCAPVSCIPTVCLAPNVNPLSLTPYSQFSNVPTADLIPPEQSEYNVLYVYFSGTPVASFFGGTPGTTPAPLNYLQIYSDDILYAQTHAFSRPVQVLEINGTYAPVTAQDLLNLARQKLFQIAEPPFPNIPFACH
jgi:hypothetical protein